MLNFYRSTLLMILWLLTYNICFFFFTPLTVYSNYIDLNIRIRLDDFFINNYYYFWTVFPLLAGFVLYLLLYYTLLILTYKVQLIYYLLIPLFIWWWSSVSEYLLVVDSIYVLYSNNELINTLLLNSINKFHPLLLYQTIVVLITTNFLGVTSQIQKYRYTFTYILSYNLTTSSNLNLFMIIGTLFLGSWWALQEASWGGFWFWDPSEVLGLGIMLWWSYVQHSTYPSQSMVMYYTKLVVGLLTLSLLYLSTQLNFSLISHNFSLISDSLLNPLFTTKTLLVIVVTYFIRYVYWFFLQNVNSFTGYSRQRIFNNTLTVTLVPALIVLLLTLIFSSSYTSIFINSIWVVAQIHVPLEAISINYLKFGLYIILVYKLYYNIRWINYITIIYISLMSNNIFIILLSLPLIKNTVYTIHYIIYIFLLGTIYGFKQVFTLWFFNLDYSITSTVTATFDMYVLNMALYNAIIETYVPLFINTNLQLNNPAFILTTFMSSITHILTNIHSNSQNFQILLSGSFKSMFLTVTSDYALTTLFVLFVLYKILYAWTSYRSIKFTV